MNLSTPKMQAPLLKKIFSPIKFTYHWSYNKIVAKICYGKTRSKMLSGATMLITAISAIRKNYGEEGVEVIHEAFKKRAVEIGKKRALKTQDKSLLAFCSSLEKGCGGTHKWHKVKSTKTCQAYRFTYCMWADVFKQLGVADIGFWICEGDEPVVTAFNDHIGFKRTMTLMEGDDCCDHVYFVKD